MLHCSPDVRVTLFQSYCTALYCSFLWNDYKMSTLSKIRVAFNHAYRKILNILVSPSGVVLVQRMQLIIFVTLKQCYVRTYMVLYKDSSIALTL